ncbi:MAG: G5 domain-containing protein [Actinomycetota bacterium]
MLHRIARLGVVLAVVAGSALVTSLDRRVTLVVDGRPLEVRTVSLSVGQLLARRGLDLGPHDEVLPGVGTRLRDGLRVVVNRAPLLTLVVNGRSRMLPVPGGTPSIRDALAQARIVLHPDDVVTPGLDLRPRTGMTVRVTKVAYRRFSQVETIPFATRTRYDPSMKVGTSQVEREGHDGHELVTYEVRMEDGREVRRDAIRAQMFQLPQDAEVVVGTDARERVATWQEGEASWYERDGVGAAHRWLPKGTPVSVTNLETGASITVIIDDRGPYGVPGRILDLSQEAFERLAPPGLGVFPVYVSW